MEVYIKLYFKTQEDNFIEMKILEIPIFTSEFNLAEKKYTRFIA